MSNISQFDLISGVNILYDGTCTFRNITLKDIRNIGLLKYNEYINILHLDVETFNSQFDSEFNPDSVSMFDILISNQTMRELLCEALSFFIVEKVSYKSQYNAFKVDGYGTTEIIGIINRNNYQEIASGVMQLNFIKDDNLKTTKKTGKKAKSILDKLRKGRANLEKSKSKDSHINIPNMISSIVAYDNNYNYENIWSLTVYQLYDLFFRLNVKTQLDIVGVRWAAWGKDEFDFSTWYKDPTKK